MPSGDDQLRNDVAAAARAFSRLNYVHAFGHVSLRLERSFLITPTRPPLALQQASDLIEVDFEGSVVSGDASARPIEVFLHGGIYLARADVRAICRTHAPFASTWPADGKVPAILHGFGGIAGSVTMYDECDLIHNAAMGSDAAGCLGDASAMILRGNGVLSVGRDLGEAAARMWSLEERCIQFSRQANRLSPFSAEDLAARSKWYPAETQRIWAWLKYLGSSDLVPGGTRT